MAKADPKKTKSPAKTKTKNPLKKVQKPKTAAKKVGAKKVIAKKIVKSSKPKAIKKSASDKKSPAKKTPAKKTKTAVVKTKVKSKPKAKASKKSPVKSRSKSAKTGKKDLKKATTKVTTKKKVSKKDNKKKPATKKAVKKVVSTKKKKAPAKKVILKKSTPKKPKAGKKPSKKSPAAKNTKQSSKSKLKLQKPKPTKTIKAKSSAQKSMKTVKKVSTSKKAVKIAKQEKKAKVSGVKLKSTKRGPKSLKVSKTTDKASKKTPKKQQLKSKTLTASQKEKLKKVKAAKKLKAIKAIPVSKKTGKGKENKEPTKKRKTLEKDTGKGAKKKKLTEKDKAKKKSPANKIQVNLKVTIQNKKAKDSNNQKTTKATKKKKEQKIPLKQNKNAALKQNKALKPKQTTPKKKKTKSIDDIGNWSPTIPAVSTASPVWGYTPPGNFGKKSLIVHQSQPPQDNTKKPVNPSKIKVTSGTSFNIKTPGDEKAVWITGMAVFPNDQLIMCDIQNVKLKLFDAVSFNHLSSVVTGRLPQDISVSALNAAEAYFTLNWEKCIQKCSIEDGQIVLGEKFAVNGCCRGIVCTTNGIITSVENAAFLGYQIQVRDYDGTIMRTISNLSGSLFSHPICFDISADGDKIIISDCALMSSTICLDIDGKQIYKFNRIPRQRGITLDESDNVYLPDHSNTNKLIVMLLSADGREVKDLITKGTKGVKENLTKPYQIVYHPVKGIPTLFLSVQENDTMYTFKLSK